MRKILSIFFLLSLLTNIYSQKLNIKFSKASTNQNDSVNIDVTVSNFNNLFGAQYSIGWDSTKFKYGRILNVIPVSSPPASGHLPSPIDVGTPGPGSILKQGQITFLWSNTNTATLPNDTRLFTIRLKAVGNPCDSTNIIMTNIPTKSEYYDENFNLLVPDFTAGTAKINGPSCVDNPPNNDSILMVSAPILTANTGTELCIPITVKNFKSIEGAQSKLKWDPAVLEFKNVKFDALPSNNYNTANLGALNFVWVAGPSGPVTIPNGNRLMEVCFTVKGAVGSMTTIDIVEKDADSEAEYINSSGKEVTFMHTDGKVTVTDPQTIKLTISNVSVAGNSNIDVDFVVDNFINVIAVQFAPTWDGSRLQFVDKISDGLVPPGVGNLIGNNRYNFNWLSNNPANPTTLPNGSKLFSIRFKGLCPGGVAGLSPVEVKDLVGFAIEFTNNLNTKIPYTVMQGSVNVTPCETDMNCVATVTSSKNVTCAGLSDGAINVSISDAKPDCQCFWLKDGQLFGSPLPVSNCNLVNIPAGNYSLEVRCNTIVSCNASATISQPAPVTISETIVNVSCNGLGSITLSPSGGSNIFTYLWSNGQTTKDISNLNAGPYSVTVSDTNNCSSTKSFTVTEASNDPISFTSEVKNVKCFGESNGSIKITISGGCSPYDITWSGSTLKTNEITGLAAGTYGVTVTDKSNPVKSSSQQIVVGGPPSALSQSVGSKSDATSGNNGSITMVVGGGTPPYAHLWTPGNLTTKDINNLTPGTYSLLTTDANNCTATSSVEIKGPTNVNELKFTTIGVVSETENNGYGISCPNLCDGEVGGGIEGGKSPYTVLITGPINYSKTLTLNSPGTFLFDKLCIGNYSVRVTDANNSSIINQSLNVTQPTAITIKRDNVKCANGAIPDGLIDISVSGGAGANYEYAWSNGKKSQDIENLAIGSYSIVVRDENGCESVISNIRIDDCNSSESCYETFTTIMTPNNDGANDVFAISCAAETDNELVVYDRWGRLVYQAKNYGNIWDGKDLNNTELPEGGYMWVFTAKSGNISNSYKGTLTILRD